MNKIANYKCSCGCEMAVCFVEMEPLTDVECQECHKRAGQEVETEHCYEKILDWIKYESEEIPAKERLNWLELVGEAINELEEELEKGEKRLYGISGCWSEGLDAFHRRLIA